MTATAARSSEETPAPNLGFGDKVPSYLIQDLEVEGKIEKGERVGVAVSKAMLVIRLESSPISNKLKVCDFITHVNNQSISRKEEFYDVFHKIKRTGGSFTIKIKRPIWCTATENLPKGYDRVPGYNYFKGLLILYPGSTLGMNIKSYNNKVFVVSVEAQSMAGMSCLIGDCIVDVDGTPVTSTRDYTEIVTRSLKTSKICILTLERPVDLSAVNVVRMALMAEKTTLVDPGLAADTTKIGEEESKRIKSGQVPQPLKSIYRPNPVSATSKHISIRGDASDIGIGCDPFNPIFMQRVPPKKGEQPNIGQVNAAKSKSTIREP